MDKLTKEYSSFIKDQNLKDEQILLDLGINYIEKIESKKRINDT